MMSQSLILTRVWGADQESKASDTVRGETMTRIKARQWRRKRPRATDGKGRDRMVSGHVIPAPRLLLSLALAHPCQQPWVPPESCLQHLTPGLPSVPRPPGTELSPLHGLAHWNQAIQSLLTVGAQQLHSAQLQVTAPQTPNAATLDKRHHILRSISKSLDGPGVAMVPHRSSSSEETH